jgi:hypothetical protein
MRSVLFAIVMLCGLAPIVPSVAATVAVAETRYVVVSASNASEAQARARMQNPGWTPQSAKMIGVNLWEVQMMK